RRSSSIEENDTSSQHEPVKAGLGQMRHPLILALILRKQCGDDARIFLTAAVEQSERTIAQTKELQQQKHPIQLLIERRLGIAPRPRQGLLHHLDEADQAQK